jgi:hypothetical protein
MRVIKWPYQQLLNPSMATALPKPWFGQKTKDNFLQGCYKNFEVKFPNFSLISLMKSRIFP